MKCCYCVCYDMHHCSDFDELTRMSVYLNRNRDVDERPMLSGFINQMQYVEHYVSSCALCFNAYCPEICIDDSTVH